MTEGPVLILDLGDRLRLRRAHPCGGREWIVDRLGADIGITCLSCSRRVLIPRPQLERRVIAHHRASLAGAVTDSGPARGTGAGA